MVQDETDYSFVDRAKVKLLNLKFVDLGENFNKLEETCLNRILEGNDVLAPIMHLGGKGQIRARSNYPIINYKNQNLAEESSRERLSKMLAAICRIGILKAHRWVGPV